uniref:Uncharacterized protein n=1 Tax=Strix occidentalis caurina TaxID=311401 RepID=A0A8D0KS25_STROC
ISYTENTPVHSWAYRKAFENIKNLNAYLLQENVGLSFIFNFLLEEMGKRIDDLEKHVADLMTEAGIENTNEELRVK